MRQKFPLHPGSRFRLSVSAAGKRADAGAVALWINGEIRGRTARRASGSGELFHGGIRHATRRLVGHIGNPQRGAKAPCGSTIWWSSISARTRMPPRRQSVATTRAERGLNAWALRRFIRVGASIPTWPSFSGFGWTVGRRSGALGLTLPSGLKSRYTRWSSNPNSRAPSMPLSLPQARHSSSPTCRRLAVLAAAALVSWASCLRRRRGAGGRRTDSCLGPRLGKR